MCDSYYLYFKIRNENNNKSSPFGNNNMICDPSTQNQSHLAFSENEIHVGPNVIL